MLIHTVDPKYTWNKFSLLDERVWAVNGSIIDVGCHPWDWSKVFIGHKRVVGIDPLATQIEGTELFKGVLGSGNGTVQMSVSGSDGQSTSMVRGGDTSVPMLTWQAFCGKFCIDRVAAMKVNIEGGEYGLLHTLGEYEYKNIDQIAISFHHWMLPGMKKATKSTLRYLEDMGYKVQSTYPKCGWYLCVRR